MLPLCPALPFLLLMQCLLPALFLGELSCLPPGPCRLPLLPCVTGTPLAADAEPSHLQLPGAHSFMPVDEPPALLLETYLVQVHGNVTLRCPGASSSWPVSWQRAGSPIQGRELPQAPGDRHRLEGSSGGAYTIADARTTDQGLYRCYICQKLAASFHLRVYSPFRRLKAAAGRVTRLIWGALASLALLSTLLIFLTWLATYCSHTRRHQVVHW